MPFRFFVEVVEVIAPTRQWALTIVAFAFASGFPTTFGTTHLGGRIGGGGGACGGGGGGAAEVAEAEAVVAAVAAEVAEAEAPST